MALNFSFMATCCIGLTGFRWLRDCEADDIDALIQFFSGKMRPNLILDKAVRYNAKFTITDCYYCTAFIFMVWYKIWLVLWIHVIYILYFCFFCLLDLPVDSSNFLKDFSDLLFWKQTQNIIGCCMCLRACISHLFVRCFEPFWS